MNIIWKYTKKFRKIATGQGDNYTIGFLLDYLYFKENYKFITVYLSSWQALDADLKAKKQITFARNLEQVGNKSMFFIFEQVKETFSKTCYWSNSKTTIKYDWWF